MDFWEIASNVIAGSLVALVVAFIARYLTDRYASRREQEQARRARDLAAAEELYRVHGQFFAAWKAWEYHCTVETAVGPASRQPGDEQVAGLLADAAAAEGGYESLMVRIALEHDLTRDEQAAAWCLRFAFKQLRYAVRENRPLQWWRSDFRNEPQVSSGYREYLAFKSLVPRVARILVESRKPAPGASDGSRAATFAEITGNGRTFVDDPRFAPKIAAERAERVQAGEGRQTGWEWVVIAEALGR